MAAKPLASDTEEKVGQCLARIATESVSATGARYVILNVGSAAGLRPGDEYILLGTNVDKDGFVPLGIDTYRDGRC